MRVARLHAPHDLRLHDEPQPNPGPGECLVHVTAVGVCGSDLHWWDEGGIGDARLTRPLVPGHEFAGVIASGPRRGDRVAADPHVACEKCEWCRTGHPNLCEAHRFAGHGGQDGAFQEFLAWPERYLFPLPARLSDDDGAMLEPLGIALHAVDLGHLKAGATVGVFGCGPIGLLILQVARLAGAVRLLATEKLGHRLAAAQAYGAEPLEADGSEAQLISALTEGRGVDVAFEAAGDNAAVEAAIAAVRPGGRVVLAGIPPDDRTSFNAYIARRKGLTLALVRRSKHTYPRALALAAQGRVDLRSLITHHFTLGRAADAFELAARREGLKVVVTP